MPIKSLTRAGARGRSSGRPALTLPGNARAIDEAAASARRMVTKRALMSAGVVLVPVPGLDFAADIALLTRLIDEINAEFGLTPDAIDRMAPRRRVLVYRTMVAFGGAMVGKLVTKELVIKSLGVVGVRITTKQAAKYVPIAGQALAAGISFAAMRYVGLQHIRECMTVAREVLQAEAADR